ncbi:hypothetical protein LPJ61_003116, partial [Coemansia biformis]
MAAAAGSGRRAASIYSRPSALCAVAVLVALASASAGTSPAGALHLLAILALPLLAQHRLGYAVLQLACLLNAHRAWGSMYGALWQRSSVAAAHAALMLASLGEQGTDMLHAILNKVFFVQEIQLVRLSKLRALTLADVWQLPERFRLATVRQEFVYNVNEPQFLLRAVARMMWQPVLLQVVLRSLSHMVDIIKPAAQSSLLYYLYASSDHPWYYGYVAATGMLVVDLAAARLNSFRGYAEAEMARASSALELELFRLPLTRNNERTFRVAPRQALVISTLLEGLKSAIALVSDTIGLVASLAALYYKVGWLAAIPAAANGAITLAVWGFSKVAGPSDRWSLYAGERQDNYSHEIYRGIRTIKLFGWERMYLEPRLQQQAATSDRQPWYALAVCAIWYILGMLAYVSLEASSYLMLHVYTMSHESATGIVAVTNLFQLNSQVMIVCRSTGYIRGKANRVRRLAHTVIKLEDALRGEPSNRIPYCDDVQPDCGPSVELDGCSFIWNKAAHAPVLEGISFGAAAGELVAVIGETGSGKSSLLLAVCGELEMTKGTGKVTGRVAYLEQSPWIMNDTMRANILFGREYDAELFGQVIYACALTEDIARWPDADLTVIGERGVNISGGQRARLALARTLYSRADIYVLDDPLSAVDAHVKRHILDHVLLGSGMLAGKLRIITTNSGHILPYAHHVVTLRDGQAAATQQSPQTYQPAPPTEPTGSNCSAADGLVEVPTAAGKPAAKSTIADGARMAPHPAAGAVQTAGWSGARQWSHWDNAVYMLRLCGLPMASMILLAAIVPPVSQFALNGLKLGLLKGSGSSAHQDDALAYLRLIIIDRVLQRAFSGLEDFGMRVVSGKYRQKDTKRAFFRSVLHAPMSFFDSTSRQHMSSAYNDGAKIMDTFIPQVVAHGILDMVDGALLLYRIGRSMPQLLLAAPIAAWIATKRHSLIDPTRIMLSVISRESDIGHRHTADIIADGKQMIRLFGVEPYFTQRHIHDQDEKLQLEAPSDALEALSHTAGTAVSSTERMVMTCLLLLKAQLTRTGITPMEVDTYSSLLRSLTERTGQIVVFPRKLRLYSVNINLYRQYACIEPEAPY